MYETSKALVTYKNQSLTCFQPVISYGKFHSMHLLPTPVLVQQIIRNGKSPDVLMIKCM